MLHNQRLPETFQAAFDDSLSCVGSAAPARTEERRFVSGKGSADQLQNRT
ncbi:hypothetical protein [Testudinibacter sp. TR-2022]|nr:hypothetical protein [Testudinibacter sp. TR-2022]